MMKNYWFTVLVAFLLLVGVSILVHHFLISGRLFDIGDFLHHETFLVLILGITGGLGIAAYSLVWRKK